MSFILVSTLSGSFFRLNVSVRTEKVFGSNLHLFRPYNVSALHAFLLLEHSDGFTYMPMSVYIRTANNRDYQSGFVITGLADE